MCISAYLFLASLTGNFICCLMIVSGKYAFSVSVWKKCGYYNQSECPLWQILHSPPLQARHKVFSSIQRLFNSLQVAGSQPSMKERKKYYLPSYTHHFYVFACFSFYSSMLSAWFHSDTSRCVEEDRFLVDHELNAWSRKSLFPY